MRAGYRATPTWKRPARRRLARRLLLAGAVVALVALFLPVALRPAATMLGKIPIFRVRTVELTGLLYLTPEEVRAILPVREGDNVLLLRPHELEAALLQNARIASARVTRRLGGVSVRLHERRPFALVSAGSLVEVDEGGVVLQPLERGLLADRPVITGLRLGSISSGERVASPALRDLLHLVELLEEPQVSLIADISEIAYQSRSRAVLRTARDQIPIVIDPEEVSLVAMRALAATLRDIRARGRQVRFVDARYHGQVVVRCAPDNENTVAPPARDKV